jgi:hypothetical protein
MKNKTGRWIAAFAVGLMLLVLLRPAIPPPKARAQRVQSVNNLARPFPNKDFVIPNMVGTNGDYPIMRR